MTDLYEKILLVQNIPRIRGIAEVQDLIKSFAYRGDMFMELAKDFGYRFFWVLQDIQNINIQIEEQIDEEMNYYEKYILAVYSKKTLKGKVLFQAQLCAYCGDYDYFIYYKRHYHLQTGKLKNYPRCKCE